MNRRLQLALLLLATGCAGNGCPDYFAVYANPERLEVAVGEVKEFSVGVECSKGVQLEFLVTPESGGFGMTSGELDCYWRVGGERTLQVSGIIPGSYTAEIVFTTHDYDFEPTHTTLRLPVRVTEGSGEGPAEWSPTGSPLNVTSLAVEASVPGAVVEMAPDNRPTAAWLENNQVRVAHWDGTAWQPMGGPLNAGLATAVPSLTFDAAGDTVVAWEASVVGEGANVYVSRWNSGAGAWQALGSGPLDVSLGENARAPSVRGGTDLAVAWSETLAGGGSRIVVKKWTGSWVNAATAEGPPGVAQEASSSPKLTLRGPVTALTLVVAWQQGSGSIRLAELSGSLWVSAGPDPFVGLGSYAFDIVGTSEDGTLVVVPPDGPTGQFQVKRVKDGVVSNAGTLRGVAGGTNPLVLHVALSHQPAGSPLLAWTYRVGSTEQVFIERWSSGQWDAVGAPVIPRSRHDRLGLGYGVAIADGSFPALALVVGDTAGPEDHSVIVHEFR